MKKIALVLGMLILMFSITACGAKSASDMALTEADARSCAEYWINGMMMITSQNAEAQYAEDEIISKALESWKKASEEFGGFGSIEECKVAVANGQTTVTAYIRCEKKDGTVEIVFDKGMNITAVTTNVKYTMAELMTKAALNTLLGMGSVFSILILICLIISCFGFISKIQTAFTRKADKVVATTAAIDNTIAQIEENEELNDDLELVAVISAAIAAYEGTATDGFVVRSIKRASSNKWNRA